MECFEVCTRCVSSGLRPEVTQTLTPELPAHILFLCMRQADWRGEEQRARALCTATVTAIKGALKVTLPALQGLSVGRAGNPAGGDWGGLHKDGNQDFTNISD